MKDHKVPEKWQDDHEEVENLMYKVSVTGEVYGQDMKVLVLQLKETSYVGPSL